MSEEPPEPPIERRNPSTIPSWVMFGFLLGVLVMLGFRADRSEPVPESAPIVEKPAPDPASETNELAIDDQPSFSVVESLFEHYRHYAFWENSRTEIAVWNTRTLDFTDYFEVLRASTGTYYRPIPELSRLPLEGYGPPDCPIKFTESAAQRAARLWAQRGGDRTREPPPPAPPPPVDLPALTPLP